MSATFTTSSALRDTGIHHLHPWVIFRVGIENYIQVEMKLVKDPNLFSLDLYTTKHIVKDLICFISCQVSLSDKHVLFPSWDEIAVLKQTNGKRVLKDSWTTKDTSQFGLGL